MSSEDIIANNQRMRALALALFPQCRKNLGSFTTVGTSTTGGGSARIKLYNVGLGLKLLVEVVANVTIGTAAPAVSGPQSPWNIVNRVRLTDYDGTDRVNISGYGLRLLNAKRSAVLRGSGLAGLYNASFGTLTAAAGANVVTQPNFAEPDTLTAVGTKNIRFFLEIPLAYDPMNDLRGAVLMQTAMGEMYLNLDFVSPFQAAGVDYPLNVAGGSTVAVNSITVNVWQDYLLLQAVQGQTPLPQLDLLTVYELNELRSTDNIQVSQEKLINFPNVRSVMGLMLYYVNNGAMTAGLGDITRFRTIVNGNNILQDDNDRSRFYTQRQLMQGNDLGASTYAFDFSRKPIETAIYGNVQLGVTPGAYTAGATHMDIAFESMYTKGSILPGLSQSA